MGVAVRGYGRIRLEVERLSIAPPPNSGLARTPAVSSKPSVAKIGDRS